MAFRAGLWAANPDDGHHDPGGGFVFGMKNGIRVFRCCDNAKYQSMTVHFDQSAWSLVCYWPRKAAECFCPLALPRSQSRFNAGEREPRLAKAPATEPSSRTRDPAGLCDHGGWHTHSPIRTKGWCRARVVLGQVGCKHRPYFLPNSSSHRGQAILSRRW